MTDTPAHTPLPWAACGDGQCSCGRLWSVPADQQVAHVNDEWGDDVDFPYGAVGGRDQQSANAAFIVRACNSHYLLIEAVERLLNMPGDIDTECNPPEMQQRALKERLEAWSFARAALSQAGGASE